MKSTIIYLAAATFFFSTHPGLASSGHGHDASKKQMEMNHVKPFKHHEVVEGVKSEFEIMRLDDMNMKDEKGATHHIMVKLSDATDGKEIKEAIGKIKVIAPDGTEQEGALKNYSGILAANFTFDKAGKYGVICLVKVGGQQKVMKFWYPHKS